MLLREFRTLRKSDPSAGRREAEIWVRTCRSPKAKSRIALEAWREDRSVHEVAEQYGVYPSEITTRKRKLLDNAGNVFRNGTGSRDKELERDREGVLRELGR